MDPVGIYNVYVPPPRGNSIQIGVTFSAQPSIDSKSESVRATDK